MTWLDPRNAATQGQNLDTQVAWMQVAQGRQLSPLQLGAVLAQFRRHKAIYAAGIVGYLDCDYTLPDGTRMNVQSNSGIHRVTVWPTASSPGDRLPHGFCVVTDWAPPVIYGPVQGTWSVRSMDISQARDDILADNYIIVAPENEIPLLVPLVRQRQAMWANRRYEAREFGAGELPIPVDLFIVDNDSLPPEFHAAIDNQVFGAEGPALYTMADTDPILLEPEAIHYVPAVSDTAATTLVLQSWRRAVLSDTAQIEQHRFCNEALHRASAAVYAPVERNITDLVTGPTGSIAVTDSASSGPTLDGDAPSATDLKFIWLTDIASSGYGDGRSILWGVQYPQLIGTVASVASTATFSKSTQIAGDPIGTDKILALPQEHGLAYVAWENGLNYPDTHVYWRAGTIRNTAAYDGANTAAFAWWQTDYFEIQRIDAQHHRDCTPKAWLTLDWAPEHEYVIFEGTGAGDLLGSVKKDTRRESTNGTGGTAFFDDVSVILTATPPPSVGTFEEAAPIARAASVSAQFNALAAPHYGHSGPIDIITRNEETPLQASLHYDYTSRHIIDFDARSQFYAAIRVSVQCSGAAWSEDGSAGERGHLKVDALPTYVASVYFEWCWGDVTGEILLATDTCTRPGFEFEQLEHFNVYTWPLDTFGTIYWMPPRIAPPGDAVAQLAAIMGQQGTNAHYAGADVLAHGATSKSEHGIEYSTDEAGVLRGAPAWVPGMLYARTFKLADFPEALWLLTATKCDAPLGNDTSGEAPAWHYMPDLGDTIANHTFHVELRDGVHFTWSDDIGDDSRPPPEGRASISIHRV